MAFIILEGLDRTGKSTVAKLYEAQGYKVVHFTAPDKKYSQPGYAGPSYLDSIIEMLVSLSGQDVIFDRSWWGERVWPFVYGRTSMLSEEDFEILQEIEDQNSTTRILMHDADEFGHWQRCVENKEPMNGSQFKSARQLYYALAEKHGFVLRTKQDFDSGSAGESADAGAATVVVQPSKVDVGGKIGIVENAPSDKRPTPAGLVLTPEQTKLQQANAINEILSSRIVKKKGSEFDAIERKIRSFLNTELGVLLGTAPIQPAQQVQATPTQQLPFSKEEIVVLKTFINRIKEKKNA
jgi:hypothetical protein